MPLVIAALSVILTAVPATAVAQPTSGVHIGQSAGFGGLSARPGEFDPADPATRSYFKLRLTPGQAYSGAVVVGNSGPEPTTLAVYSTDGLTGATSGVVYSDRRTPLRAAGRWLVPKLSQVTVAPHSSERVPFTIRVPAGVRPGVYLAGIALQDASSPESRGRFLSVRQVLRIVVGVEVRVPGPAPTALRLGRAAIRVNPGTDATSIIIGIANTGRLLCKPKLAVTVRGRAGQSSVERQLDTVLPGDEIAYPMPWKRLEPGSYSVSARASECGSASTLREVVRANGTPNAPGTGAGSNMAAGTRAARASSSWPIILIALLGLVVGLVLGIAIVRTRDRRSDESRTERG